MSAAMPLTGRGIVITRPAAQAAELAGRVRALGARPILFPVIEILDVEDRAALDRILSGLESFDLAIFVSPNAVAKAAEAIRALRPLPLAMPVAAIGRGTARALRTLGFSNVVAPSSGADSESLLEVPELLSVAARRIVIFRGVGGRELLSETLTARGACVVHAECYRRVKPRADIAVLTAAWQRNEIDAAVITSSEGLRNLVELLPERERANLARTPLFVPHPRIAATANELGLRSIRVTGSGDEAIVAALVESFSSIT